MICERHTKFLSNRFIDPAWIVSACEEYGCYVEAPYPAVTNLGLMSLVAGGDPCICDQDFIVKIFTAGDMETSKFLWCYADDEAANNNWFGRNPIFHSIWEKIADNSGGTSYYKYDVIQASWSQAKYLAVEEVIGGNSDLEFYQLGCADNAMAHISTIDASPMAGTRVLMVELAGYNDLIVIYKHSGGSHKIKRTTDNGLTWTEIYSGSDFSDPISCKFSKGYLYLTYSNGASSIRVMYSNDLGSTWQTLETDADAVITTAALLVLDGGNFGLIKQKETGNVLYFYQAIPGSAFGAGVVVDAVIASNINALTAENILGTLMIVSWENTPPAYCKYYLSTDQGATWSAEANYHYHTNGGIFSSINNFKLRLVDSSPTMCISGISTTYGIIFLRGYQWRNVTEISFYDELWESVAAPDNAIFNWIRYTGGTGTYTLETDLESLFNKPAGAGNYIYFQNPAAVNPSYLNAGGKILCRIKSLLGDNSSPESSFAIYLLIRYSGVANGIWLAIRITPTCLKVYDNISATYKGTQYDHDFTHYHDFLIAYKNTKISIWFREINSLEWINIESNLSVLDTKGTATSNIAFGLVESIGIQTQAYVMLFYYTSQQSGIGSDDGLADGFTNPADLVQCPTWDGLIYLDQGIGIIWGGSDAIVGDKWEVKTAYQFAVENILTDSPSEYWRTETDSQECNIIFDSGDCDFPWNGAALVNTNFLTAYLESDDADTFDSNGGNPQNQLALDATLDTGTADAVDECWIQDMSQSWKPHQWKGKYLRITSGAAAGNTYEIDDNSEHTVYAYGETFVTDGIVATDNFKIFGDRMGGELAHGMARRRYTRIRIPSQTTADGYYRIGKFVAGMMHEIDPCMEWQFTDGAVPNVGIIESKAGIRYASRRGQRRRTFSVRYTGALRDLREELTALFDYLDYSLEPFVFWEDIERDENDLRLVRAIGNLTYNNQVLYLASDGYIDRVDEVDALVLEEEL